MNPDEQIFEHTGIRIMKAANGDLLFCDPGAITGIRDSFMITNEAFSHAHQGVMFQALVEYIQKHEKVRDTRHVDFSYIGSSTENQ
jgi:hypothetical protein